MDSLISGATGDMCLRGLGAEAAAQDDDTPLPTRAEDVRQRSDARPRAHHAPTNCARDTLSCRVSLAPQVDKFMAELAAAAAGGELPPVEEPSKAEEP